VDYWAGDLGWFYAQANESYMPAYAVHPKSLTIIKVAKGDLG
jgi:hypothetical protein